MQTPSEETMLTFELCSDGETVEIHGDRDGLLRLAKGLAELAVSDHTDHMHLMTEAWGGPGLTNLRQGLDNKLLHHVKLFVWPNESDFERGPQQV
jgi:Immunity protein 32